MLRAMVTNRTIVGRSSSHFTRTVRIFALELGVAHSFQVARNLSSLSSADFGENPALRLPILKESGQVRFGALNICRELARASSRSLHIVWPEQLTTPLLANAQELTVQAMASAVDLIMSRGSADETSSFVAKRRASLESSVRWLDAHIDAALATLPARDLSYLETTLFCLTEHLGFREVLSTEPFARLNEFRSTFAERES